MLTWSRWRRCSARMTPTASCSIRAAAVPAAGVVPDARERAEGVSAGPRTRGAGVGAAAGAEPAPRPGQRAAMLLETAERLGEHEKDGAMLHGSTRRPARAYRARVPASGKR